MALKPNTMFAQPRTPRKKRQSALIQFLNRIQHSRFSNLWRSVLIVLVLLQLGCIAILPGIRQMAAVNGEIPLRANQPPWLNGRFLPVGDAWGLHHGKWNDRFLIYKIYTEDGAIHEGIFPHSQTFPQMRFYQWQQAARLIGLETVTQQKQLVRYIVEQLGVVPLRIELHTARWNWDRNHIPLWLKGTHSKLKMQVQLKKLGHYNGVTETYTPAQRKK